MGLKVTGVDGTIITHGGVDTGEGVCVLCYHQYTHDSSNSLVSHIIWFLCKCPRNVKCLGSGKGLV